MKGFFIFHIFVALESQKTILAEQITYYIIAKLIIIKKIIKSLLQILGELCKEIV